MRTNHSECKHVCHKLFLIANLKYVFLIIRLFFNPYLSIKTFLCRVKMANRQSASAWADQNSDDFDIEDNSHLVNNDIYAHHVYQQRAIEAHEDGIERLTRAATRQKNMAYEIANEVDTHNEILDDIDNGVTRTDENLRKNTRNIGRVTRQSGSCFYWLIILLLAGVILTLAIL